MSKRVVCLAGGVGAARFLQGLVKVVQPENIVVISNTADDIDFYGLHVSPDPDIVTYTLAGIVDEEKGWGISRDTFTCLNKLHDYGLETWFKVGDKDLATHIFRSYLMKKGNSLDQILQTLTKILDVKVRILPMTNDSVASKIVTDSGKIHFEEYLVKKKSKPKVYDVIYEGAETAKPAPGVIEAIREAEGIIICPSNPIVSIGPMLAIKEIKEELMTTEARIIAISPIIGGTTVKGPADKLMKAVGFEPSTYSVALLYKDFLDILVIDDVDQSETEKIQMIGIKAVTTKTLMKTMQDKVELARFVLRNLD